MHGLSDLRLISAWLAIDCHGENVLCMHAINFFVLSLLHNSCGNSYAVFNFAQLSIEYQHLTLVPILW